ncbi:uncharacterized protein A4U43_C02F18420 [Asparagus officinalis]|uniref:Uncharacterized protein n=1 Tax=Asparagus officinalis TaxID=4686 RepID=A0A5P1FJZ8_ASPOF|nr:uncharacterized protein A4U43_C02F18420 [Asparagus officinalis]
MLTARVADPDGRSATANSVAGRQVASSGLQADLREGREVGAGPGRGRGLRQRRGDDRRQGEVVRGGRTDEAGGGGIMEASMGYEWREETRSKALNRGSAEGVEGGAVRIASAGWSSASRSMRRPLGWFVRSKERNKREREMKRLGFLLGVWLMSRGRGRSCLFEEENYAIAKD